MISCCFSLDSICFKLLLWCWYVLLHHSALDSNWLAWRIRLNGLIAYIEPWFFFESHAQNFALKGVNSITRNLIVLHFFNHLSFIIVLDVWAKGIKRVFLEGINDLSRSFLKEVLYWANSHEGIGDIQQEA